MAIGVGVVTSYSKEGNYTGSYRPESGQPLLHKKGSDKVAEETVPFRCRSLGIILAFLHICQGTVGAAL